MINVNLHPRDLKAKTPQRIWAVFYIEKNRIKIDTNQFVYPKDWSKTQQKLLTSHEDSAKLNKLLKEQKEFITDVSERILNKLKYDKKRFYKDNFQPELQNEFNRNFKIGENLPKTEGEIVDFVSFMEQYIDSRKDLEEGSHQVMRNVRKHILFAFNLVNPQVLMQWKKMSNYERKTNPEFLKASKQIDFDEINYNWFVKFNTYLLNATYTETKNGITSVIPISKNTIAKQIRTAMQFVNEAVKAGYVHNLSYKGFTCSKEEADSIYLTWDEIERIKALQLDPHSKQGKVRNLFVFNCYLGLRYSDLKRLDKNRFTTTIGAKMPQLSLKIRMKKVDTVVMFPILKSAEDIMKIYDYKLPKVVDSKYNIEIKKICKMASIVELETKRETRGGAKIVHTIPKYEMVSSHTARRSFATNFYEDGVPIKQLMAVTGHTTEAAFKIYVKSRVESKFAEFLAVGANR